jgi:hypothetical protein
VLAVADILKFVFNSRDNGTSDENRAVVRGSVSFFGTYTLDADDSLTLHIELLRGIAIAILVAL